MPQLTLDDLSELFTWIVDAQGFLPLSEGAKPAVDKLLEYQNVLKEQKNPAWVEQMPIINEEKSADGYADMWSDENIAKFGSLL